MLMKTTRLLLPFTHGVDMEALDYGVLLAKSHHAILVPLALLIVPERRWSKGVRLEQVQEAKDFLEAVRYKAQRQMVPIERFEMVTYDVVQSIGDLVRQMACDGVVLTVRGQDGILLDTDEVEQLMEQLLCTFYLIHLPPRKEIDLFQPLQRLSSWLLGQRKRTDRQLLVPWTPQAQAERILEVPAHSLAADLAKPTLSSARTREKSSS
jgi:hypothetical protein